MGFLKHASRRPEDDETREPEQQAEPTEVQVADLPPPPFVTVGGLSEERPEDEQSERSDD
jgi:hypothetical protein